MRPADRREGLTAVDESIDLILRQPGHGLAVHVALKLHEIAARRVVQREFAAGQPLDGIGLGLGDVGPEPEFASWAAIWRSGFPEALESRARNSRRRL